MTEELGFTPLDMHEEIYEDGMSAKMVDNRLLWVDGSYIDTEGLHPELIVELMEQPHYAAVCILHNYDIALKMR